MIRPALIIGSLLISLAGISQQKITALVEDDGTGSPVSYASVTSARQLLRCGCSQSSAPSFFYLGNEEGINFFKEAEQSAWQRGGEYTISVRMMMK